MNENKKFENAQRIKQSLIETWDLCRKHFYPEGRRIRYQPTMQMMDDEQPHTIKNTINKYTIKGMELRKELVSTIMEMMFPKYSNWVTIKWKKESAESIIRKYQEVVEQLNGQEAPPIEDIFKNIQDGFDNISEEAIINMNRADSKLLATTAADLLVTYGWCVLIPSEEGIEICNMDNVYLYADNDRVTDIFTTYRVSFQEAIGHEKTQHISRVISSEIFKTSRGKSRIIEHTIQNKDGSQECITYFKSIAKVNIISEMHFSKNSPNLIVQNISRPNRDDPYSVSPAMAALPIYAKVNKLEQLQNELAQISTYGIYAQRDMGHLDIDDNFFKKTPDGALVHRYKGDKQPVNLINSASNEMVAKESRDDYYAELGKLFLVSNTQIGKTPPSAEQARINEEHFQSDKQTIYNMLKIGFNSWYYYFIDNIFEEKMSDIEKAYGGLVPATLLINNTTLINSVVIEYKSIFDFNVKLQTLQNFLQTIELMARLLGSDYAQAAVNQQVLHRLLQEINSDDELINLTSIIQENLEKIQKQRMVEAQSHINPEQQQNQGE
jgi:hypothetical protein